MANANIALIPAQGVRQTGQVISNVGNQLLDALVTARQGQRQEAQANRLFQLQQAQEELLAAAAQREATEDRRAQALQNMQLLNTAADQLLQTDSARRPQQLQAIVSQLGGFLPPEALTEISGMSLDDASIQELKGATQAAANQLGGSAQLTTFREMTRGLTPEQVEQARLIDLGLAPRAVGTGAITTATTEGLTEQVAESEAAIAGRKKFAEKTGESRVKAIDEGFDQIQKIDANIRNIDRAIRAIDDGASTGAVESRFFPTLRRATVELEQVQKELGLDVIGSVTFGALSEGELDLALQTALPTGLEPAALKEFLVNKKAAQDKLRSYYEQQIDFLDQGGTIAGFLRSQERPQQPVQRNAPFLPNIGQEQTLPVINTKGWRLMQDASGNKAYVGPNGEIEEVE